MSALDDVVKAPCHVVAKVIETDFVICGVGYVGGICRFALRPVHAGSDDAYREPQKLIYLAHPLGVALCKVVVDGDDMHPFARQRVQICGKGSHQRLTFAGLHFGDAPLVKDYSAYQLHPEVAHIKHSLCRLAADREGFVQKVVELFAVFEPTSEQFRLPPQFVV